MATETLRFYTPSKIRLATAIEFPDGGVYEVYPTRTYFADRATWESKFSKMTGFFQEGEKLEPEYLPHKKLKVCDTKPTDDKKWNRKTYLRLQREMDDFKNPSYKDMFTDIVYISEDTVEVTLNGNRWRIKRCLNFLGKPPTLWCNGELQTWETDDWSPAFMSATYLLAYSLCREDFIDSI